MIIFTTETASEYSEKFNSYLAKKHSIPCWIESEPNNWKNAILTGVSDDQFIIMDLNMKIITASRVMLRNEDVDAMNSIPLSEKITEFAGRLMESIGRIFGKTWNFIWSETFGIGIFMIGFISILIWAVASDTKNVHVLNAVETIPPKVTTVAKFGTHHLITYDAAISKECHRNKGECSITDTVPLQSIYSYLSNGGCYISIRVAGTNGDYYRSDVLSSSDSTKCKEYLIYHPIIKH